MPVSWSRRSTPQLGPAGIAASARIGARPQIRDAVLGVKSADSNPRLPGFREPTSSRAAEVPVLVKWRARSRRADARRLRPAPADKGQ